MAGDISRQNGKKGGRPKGKELTPNQAVFVEEFAASGNATEAYGKAYPKCSEKARGPNAARLLQTNDRVKKAVAVAHAARLARAQMDGDEALRAITTMARADIRKLFDDAGNLLPVHSWPDEAADAVEAIKVRRVWNKATESEDEIIEVKCASKLRAREDMAKARGRLVEKHEHHVRPLTALHLKQCSDEELAILAQAEQIMTRVFAEAVAGAA